MNNVVKILMDRDGISQSDAERDVLEVSKMIHEAIARGDFFEPEEIMAEELGLEPDYILEII